MSRYVVIGAGAVGISLAAELSFAGVEHVLVGRGESARRLAADGVTYQRGLERLRPRLVVAGAPAEVELRDDDVLVLTTKTQDADSALAVWSGQPVKDFTAAQLPLVTLQNGLDAERSALRRFNRVYGGSLMTPARFIEAGEVVVGAAPKVGIITLGRYPHGLDPDAEHIASDLRLASYVVQTTEQIVRWKAAKILFSVRNGVEVLTGDKNELSDRIAAEAQAVLVAAGMDVADMEAERTESLDEMRMVEGSGILPGQQSTWQSFQRGAGSSEVDFLNGEIVLLGRLHGVPTPANAALQQVLAAAIAAGEGPGVRAVSEVLNLEKRFS